jgi:DNA-binding NarL/FixJ family response regulator
MPPPLTTAAGDIQALRALKAGATGYLLRTLLRTELIDTIRMTHAGQRRIPPEIARQLAEHAADDILTVRELEELREIVKGQSNKVIAFNLNIVEYTVKNHIKSMLSKLGTDDRTGAAMIAVRRGYIDAPDNAWLPISTWFVSVRPTGNSKCGLASVDMDDLAGDKCSVA